MNPIISAQELKEKFVDFARNSTDALSLIFGAGASLGYSRQDNYFYKPPTVAELLSDTNHLVQQIIAKPEHSSIRGQRAHIERSIQSLGGDLEAYLSDIYKNDTADNRFPSVLRYLEDVFTSASQQVDLDDNHYKSLLSRVRDLRGSKPWSMITFNYDTILEQSLEDLPIFVPGRTFQFDEDYLDPNPKFFKMHGGVNHRYITPQESGANSHPSSHELFTKMMSDDRPVEKFLELNPTGKPVPGIVGHRTYKDVGGRIIYNFPLMMIPIHTSTKSRNSFFNRQLEHSKKEISKSRMVIAIGYQFGDSAFIDSLRGLELEESFLILVGSKDLLQKTTESRAYREASKVWPKENIRIFGEDGFGKFVEALY